MQLQEPYPKHSVKTIVDNDPCSEGDEPLLTVVLDNLLSNAWIYSSKTPQPAIEFGCVVEIHETVFYVNEIGVDFDTKYVDKVFDIFQRLHGSETEILYSRTQMRFAW
jgi:light-regulated signal transduction histidine kinase (bacteriophytochrome)